MTQGLVPGAKCGQPLCANGYTVSKSPLFFFRLVMQATRDYAITGVIEACLLFRFDPLPLVSFT